MRLVLFLVLTVLLSLPWWWLSREHGGYGYITFLMWSPALAAAIAVKLTRGKLSELAWRGAQPKWWLGGWALTIGILVLANTPVFAAHLVAYPDPAGLAAAVKATAMKDAATAPMLLWYAVIVSTAGMVRMAGPALGEEIGWRGLLTPLACRRFGFAGGALATGLIWSAWHFPLMIGKVSPLGIVNFTVAITGLSIAYAWFRLRSNSVWPTTVMHALHNALGASFFVALATPGPAADKWLDETGFALPVVGVVVGLVFLYLGRNLGRSDEPVAA